MTPELTVFIDTVNFWNTYEEIKKEKIKGIIDTVKLLSAMILLFQGRSGHTQKWTKSLVFFRPYNYFVVVSLCDPFQVSIFSVIKLVILYILRIIRSKNSNF